MVSVANNIKDLYKSASIFIFDSVEYFYIEYYYLILTYTYLTTGSMSAMSYAPTILSGSLTKKRAVSLSLLSVHVTTVFV